MARYIDADKLKEECYYYDTEEDLERYVIKHGYADVVPKSEVDYWKQQTFNACMNNGYLDPKIITHLLENADGHDDPTGEKGTEGLEAAISYAKSDTARKILMDIKALMQIIILDYKNIGSFDNAEIVGYVRDHLLSELEKRYTGGEG